MTTRLLLVRHGETEWHAENRYAGSSEVGLTERGRSQARALAVHLRELADPPGALYRSPQDRARETAAPCADALGLTPVVVDDLREVHYGIAEGRTLAELRRSDPEAVERFLADPVAGSFPEAEDPVSATDRAVAALRDIAASEQGPVLVVAHNALLRLALCRLLGIPPATYRSVFPALENCAVTEIGIDGERTSLRRFNQPTDARK